MILRSSSGARSSVSSAPAAGRAALMGLGCFGGRPRARRTAQPGTTREGQSGGSGQGQSQSGWLGAGGRALKQPRRLPPPASRSSAPGRPRPAPPSPAPPPSAAPACVHPGSRRVIVSADQSAPGAVRRQGCHSSSQGPGARGRAKSWLGGAGLLGVVLQRGRWVVREEVS